MGTRRQEKTSKSPVQEIVSPERTSCKERSNAHPSIPHTCAADQKYPAVEVNDPNFIRIKYSRYADDWLIGICGPRTLAEHIKEELKEFLMQKLHLTLSEEKTQITHAREEQAHFLGTRLAIGRGGVQRIVTTHNGSGRPIQRRSTGSEIVMTAPKNELIKKLHNKGFCTAIG